MPLDPRRRLGPEGEPVMLADEWLAYFGTVVDRLREHAIEVADALDAAIAVRQTLMVADVPDGQSVPWSAFLDAQPTELDRADLQSKLNRSLNPDALPKEQNR